MCGIFGIWNANAEPINLVSIRQATTLLLHRGPDDEGYLLVNTRAGRTVPCGGPDSSPSLNLAPVDSLSGENFDLALGFRRLAILDLSPAGHQPMPSTDGQCWIVFNGEIYNYLELRAELAGYGYHFRTGTDTEVILAAYQQWGHACLSRFNGMWAFALWDARQRHLFCARDRFGVKPFYYVSDGQRFAFASEIKALLGSGLVDARPNDPLIYDFLAGLEDHSPETMFAGIYQLPPSHYLLIKAGGEPQVQRWWNLPINRDLGVGPASPATIDRFRELLHDSVRLRLQSDVPIGSCLSGGLDSSSIVCLANQLIRSEGIDPTIVGDRQKTFSSCFDDPRFDERPFIETVLEQTEAERNLAFPDGAALWDELSLLAWHQDEPFGSTSIYAQWNVMRTAAARGVKVLLDGQGGDELLAGYFRYYPFLVAQLARSGHFREAQVTISAVARLTGHPYRRLRLATLHLASPPVAQAWVGRSRLATRLLVDSANSILPLEPTFAARHADRRSHLRQGVRLGEMDLADRLYADVFYHSLPSLLRYEDRDSMAFSIEARVPFLDYRLVEFVFSLPARYRIQDGWTKWILRESMRGVLPEAIRLRRDKKGFVTPEVIWLRAHRDNIRQLFGPDEPRITPYLNVRALLSTLDDHLDRLPVVGTTHLWRVISLEMWLRVFFGRFLISPPRQAEGIVPWEPSAGRPQRSGG